MTAIARTALPRSRYVERVENYTPSRGGRARVDRLPDGRTALVFRVTATGRGELHVAGPRRLALFKEAASLERAVAVVFRPGWSRPLLGVPAHELTDTYVPLEDIWGSHTLRLVGELNDAGSTSEVVTRLEGAFVRFARPAWEPSSAIVARRAAVLLEEVGARVGDVAEDLGLTPRHLRRVFADNIGVGPKAFARSARLQRAVKLSRISSDWGRIAIDAGYYDQAHLISDFRALIGLTPGAYARAVSSCRRDTCTSAP